MHLLKERRYLILLLPALIGIAMSVNSCKKDNSDTVAYFLTYGKWQLASVTRESFVGDTTKGKVIFNTTCNLNQIFKFNEDGTCTYTNYHCVSQNSTGRWTLINDDLTLNTTLMALDTLVGGTVDVKAAPVFTTAQISNLGQYSFVIKTGYTSTYYTSKTAREIYTYGFVHATN